MILVAATIEHDRGDASVLSLLGDQFADLLGGFGLGALETSEIAGQSGFAHQSDALGVIDDLGNHVTVGTGNHQTRKLRGTADVLAQTSVTALKRDLLALTENLDAHYLPAFPALRRMCSSAYLMPLPL